ncbi:hypothetical protein K502DRAFT_94228 [Neoconidiobolus thromboides FSU 785]|nr:hypothetical protein K502DRAFT_94228 [Neoconidiobolus thromboides FSU 785]
MPTCEDIREELIECMQKSECMDKFGYPIQKCFEKENAHLIDEECLAIRKAYTECKRSLLNMRYRFRGPKTSHT